MAADGLGAASRSRWSSAWRSALGGEQDTAPAGIEALLDRGLAALAYLGSLAAIAARVVRAPATPAPDSAPAHRRAGVRTRPELV